MPISKTPVSLTVNSGTCQTTYHPGEYFQPAGVIVIVNYDDGTSSYLSSYIYSPQRALTPSDNQITFSYRENGVTVYGYLPITVYGLTSMILDTSNFHRYNGQYSNEVVDLEGIGITVYFNDGTHQTRSLSQCEVTINGNNTNILSSGYNTIVIKYFTVQSTVYINTTNYPENLLYNSSPFDNPKWCLSTLEMAYTQSLITLNEGGHSFELTMTHFPNMLNNIHSRSDEIGNHWFLSLKESIVELTSSKATYINELGEVISLYKVSGIYVDKKGLGLVLKISQPQTGYSTLYLIDGTEKVFNSDGYLTSIKKNSLTLTIVYHSGSNRIDRAYFENNSNTYLLFNYNNSSHTSLTSISSYLDNNFVNQVSISKSSGNITSLSMTGNNPSNTPLNIVNFTYYDSTALKTITNSQTKECIELTNYKYRISSYGPDGYRLEKIRRGVMNGSSFTSYKSVTKNSVSLLNNSDTSYQLCILKDEKNISTTYFIKANGNIISQLEKTSTDTYKSFERLSGYPVSFNNTSTDSAYSVNGSNGYIIDAEKTISCSLSELICINQSSDSKNNILSISFYARLTNNNISAVLLTVGSDQYIQPIFNPNNSNLFIKVSINFICDNPSRTLTIRFISNNDLSSASGGIIYDPMINYGQINEIVYKDNNHQYSFNDINKVSSNTGIFTLNDILLALRCKAHFNKNIIYYNNGEEAFGTSYPNSTNFISRTNITLFSFQNLLSNFYQRIYSRVERYKDNDYEINSLETYKHYLYSSSGLVITTEQTNRVEYPGYYSKSETDTITETYDTYCKLVSKSEEKTYSDSHYVFFISEYQYAYNIYGDLIEVKKVCGNEEIIVESNTYDSNGRLLTKDDSNKGVSTSYNNNGDISSLSPRVISNNAFITLTDITNSFQRDIYYRLTNNVFAVNNVTKATNSVNYDSKGLIQDVTSQSSTTKGYRFVNDNNLLKVTHNTLNDNVVTEIDYEETSYSNSGETNIVYWGNNNSHHYSVSKDKYGRLEEIELDSSVNTFNFAYFNNKESSYCSEITEINCTEILYEEQYNYFTYGNNISTGLLESITIKYDNKWLLKKQFDKSGNLFYLIPQYNTLDFTPETFIYYSPISSKTRQSSINIGGDDIPQASLVYEYDGFNHLTDIVQLASSSVYDLNRYVFNYLDLNNHTTDILHSFTYFGSKNGSVYRYELIDTLTYDNRGRISSISSITTVNGTPSSSSSSFTYDEFSRLTHSTIGSKNITYTYNSYGFLLKESNDDTDISLNYSYSQHGRITKIEEKYLNTILVKQTDFSYDVLGNRINAITSDSNLSILSSISYTYYHHQLLSVQIDNNDTVYFSYSPHNKRIKKVQGSKTTYYGYDSDKLVYLRQINGSNILTLIFLYDIRGVCGVRMLANSNYSLSDDTTFSFIKNELNDIVAILDEDGNCVVRYTYDEWGNVLSVDYDTSAPSYLIFLANNNPFRYRGYIYDEETKLYYLNSRYYDPSTHSFISLDDYSYLDSTSITGVNLYCYCNYNPIMYRDESGNSPWEDFLGLFGYEARTAVGYEAPNLFSLQCFEVDKLHYSISSKGNKHVFYAFSESYSSITDLFTTNFLFGVGINAGDRVAFEISLQNWGVNYSLNTSYFLVSVGGSIFGDLFIEFGTMDKNSIDDVDLTRIRINPKIPVLVAIVVFYSLFSGDFETLKKLIWN